MENASHIMACLAVEIEKTFTLQMLRGVLSSHASNYDQCAQILFINQWDYKVYCSRAGFYTEYWIVLYLQ